MAVEYNIAESIGSSGLLVDDGEALGSRGLLFDHRIHLDSAPDVDMVLLTESPMANLIED
jgi:hypothetical protein